ncbi:MAG: VTT domain-containing protein [Candidatus Doudnabacteria bacterium]|nr:VTT domain-containing protein [Candidatus Doudnabacteria bacterium]
MKRRILYLVLLIGFLAAIFSASTYLQDVFFRFTDVLARFVAAHGFWGVLIFVGLAALSAMLGAVSSIPLVPSAVLIWGIPQTLALLLSGWVIGNVFSFGVGRRFGYPLVQRVVGRQRLSAWLSSLESRLSFFVLLLFRLTTPSETGYVFGILKYNFWKYLLITMLSEIPIALIAVYGSEVFIDVLR